MVLRRTSDEVKQVTDLRWEDAQKAEKQHYLSTNRLKNVAQSVNESQFISLNFQLTQEFFVNKDVLEVGCGPSAEIHKISNARSRVGLDPLAEQLRDFYPTNVIHITGKAEELPFKDKSFDVILCLNVLDHVQNPIIALEQMKRCLKEKGILLLWVQTYSAPRKIREHLGVIDRPHPHHFSDSEIVSLLSKLGFKLDYHNSKRPSVQAEMHLITSRFVSGMKSLFANLFLGLHESSYMCSKYFS